MCIGGSPKGAPVLITTIKLLEFLVEWSLDEVDNSALNSESFILASLLIVAVKFKDCVTSLELVEASINSVAVIP